MNHEVSILDYWEFLKRNWKSIALTAFIAGLLTAGINYLYLKPLYRAEATVLPRKDAGESGLMASLGQLTGGAGLAMMGNRSADLAEILGSRMMADRIIARFDLKQKFKGWQTREDLYDKLRRATTVTTPSLKNNVLSVAVKSGDPQLAADVANGYIEELRLILNEIGYSQAAKSSSFIKSQLERNKKDLSEAESRLSDFQAKNRLVSLPETVRSSIGALSQLETQQIANSLSLDSSAGEIGAIERGVQALQVDPSALVQLKIKKRALTAQQDAIKKARQDYMERLAALPPKAIALARLERDVQIQNAVYQLLMQQYESSLIAEAKDSDAFIPLDRAIAPETPIGPKRSLNTLIGMLGGAFLALLVAFLRELLAAYRKPAALDSVLERS